MRYFGYSTGAIAKGDIAAALACLATTRSQAVEFSALRLAELDPILSYLKSRDCPDFKYCSFHVPSRIQPEDEVAVLHALAPIVHRRWPIIVHPDAISRWDLWRKLGPLVLIENMDQRKETGRTADELAQIFERLPEAGLCLDLGHLRQLDPTMVEAYRIIHRYGERIRQLHLSDVDSSSKHHPLNIPALTSFIRVAPLLPRRAAVILESPVACTEVREQLLMAQILFAAADAHRWKNIQAHAESHRQIPVGREIGISVHGVPLRILESEEDSRMLELFGSIREMRQRAEPASWHYFRRTFFPAAGLDGAVLDETEKVSTTSPFLAADI